MKVICLYMCMCISICDYFGDILTLDLKLFLFTLIFKNNNLPSGSTLIPWQLNITSLHRSWTMSCDMRLLGCKKFMFTLIFGVCLVRALNVYIISFVFSFISIGVCVNAREQWVDSYILMCSMLDSGLLYRVSNYPVLLFLRLMFTSEKKVIRRDGGFT